MTKKKKKPGKTDKRKKTYWPAKRKFDGKRYIIGDIFNSKAEVEKGKEWLKKKTGAKSVRTVKSTKVKALVKGGRTKGRYAVYIR